MKLPHFVQIEPVGQCNLAARCARFSSATTARHAAPAFMDFDVFARLIDQFTRTDGAPVAGTRRADDAPRLFDMIEYAVAQGIRVTSTSNMTLLSPRRAELCVTSRAWPSSTSRSIRPTRRFTSGFASAPLRAGRENLALLNATRERLASQQPRLKLVGVLMRQTLDGLPDLVRLAHQWSIEELFVQHLCHDFAESSLPAEYRPMRDFVDAQTLLSEDWEHIEEVFAATPASCRRARNRTAAPLAPGESTSAGNARTQSAATGPGCGATSAIKGLAMPCCTIATPDRFNFGSVATTE